MGFPLLLRRSANCGVLDAGGGPFVASWVGGIEAASHGVSDLGEFGAGFQRIFASDAWFQAQQRIQQWLLKVFVGSDLPVTVCVFPVH
jgi:hypothetical protein